MRHSSEMRACGSAACKPRSTRFNKTWTHNVYVQGTETAREDLGSSLLLTNSTQLASSDTNPRCCSSLRPRLLSGISSRRWWSAARKRSSSPPSRRPSSPATAIPWPARFAASTSSRLFLTGTVRHDQNTDTQDFTTWHISASYLVPGGVFRLHGSVGTGVKYPSFGDLYRLLPRFFAPNPNLVAREIDRLRLRRRRPSSSAGGLSLDVTYFHADLTNEIDLACVHVPVFHLHAFQPVGAKHAERRSRSRRATRVTPAAHDRRRLTPTCDATEDDGLRGGPPSAALRPHGRQLRLPWRVAGNVNLGRHLQRHDARRGVLCHSRAVGQRAGIAR